MSVILSHYISRFIYLLYKGVVWFTLSFFENMLSSGQSELFKDRNFTKIRFLKYLELIKIKACKNFKTTLKLKPLKARMPRNVYKWKSILS